MSTKNEIVGNETFSIIKSAVDKMVNLIKPTYGPSNNKVIIDKLPYRLVVDDGVQIARDFELEDPKENAVVKIIRETAIATNDRAGDGTTGALIMLQAIIGEVARRSVFNGRKIELELKGALVEVQEQLKNMATPIETQEELRKVARISIDDEKIANIIADLYFELGKDGIITLGASQTLETTVEKADGIKIASGYLSPYMVTNPERMETEIEKPYFLITDYTLTESSDILPILNKLVADGKNNIVIIAQNVEQRALATLVLNLPQVINPATKSPGKVVSVAIAAPQTADKQYMEDLALLTGAKMFTVDKGEKIENAEVEDLGHAEKITVRDGESIIVNPAGSKSDIENAIGALQASIVAQADKTKRDAVKTRIARFTNKLAVIKVGALTMNEQRALKYKVEDAVNSVKAAYKNGVVQGSGLALARIITKSQILNAALKYPARQIRENTGIDFDIEDVVSMANRGDVENLVTGEKGTALAAGVVDPLDVLLAGVESAVSIASLLITSSGMIVESQEHVE